MQSIVSFLVSFVVAITIGTLLFPAPRPKAKQAPPRPARAAPTLDFLPGLPSLIVPPLDDVSRQYKVAWQALKSGRYPEAERAYLEILIRHPEDRKAMDALVTVQRLAANQDRGVLQNQATRFRRAIAGEGVENERYTRQEMALLAKANVSASREIATEDALRLTALSRTSIGRELVRPDTAPGTAVNPVRNALSRVRSRIVGIAASLGLESRKPAPRPSERGRLLRRAMDPRSTRPALVTPARPSPLTTAAPPGTPSSTSQPPRVGAPPVPVIGTLAGGPGNAMPSTSAGGPARPDETGKGSAGPPSTPFPLKEGGHEGGTGGGGGSGKGGGGSGGSTGGSGAGNTGSGGSTGGSGAGNAGSGGGGSAGGTGGSGGTSAGGTGAGAGGAGKPGKAGNDESDDKGDKGKGEKDGKGDKGDKGKGKDD